MTHLVSELEVLRDAGSILYEKPLSDFAGKEEERDLFAHLALVRAGYSVTVLAEDAPEGYSNIDLLVDGAKWEVKSPNGSTLRGVETAVRRARTQFKRQFATDYPPRLVFNSAFYRVDPALVLPELRRRLEQHGFKQGLLVDAQGTVTEVDIKKEGRRSY